MTKEEKIKELIKSWKEWKFLSLKEIGKKLGVSDRTIYTWRKELISRGVDLSLPFQEKKERVDFDKIVKEAKR